MVLPMYAAPPTWRPMARPAQPSTRGAGSRCWGRWACLSPERPGPTAWRACHVGGSSSSSRSEQQQYNSVAAAAAATLHLKDSARTLRFILLRDWQQYCIMVAVYVCMPLGAVEDVCRMEAVSYVHAGLVLMPKYL